MQFQITRTPLWSFVPSMILGQLISNLVVHRITDAWWGWLLATVLWLVILCTGTWLLNRLVPCHLTVADSGISVGNTQYNANDIESIAISKYKFRTITIYSKRERFPTRLTPMKLYRKEAAIAVEQWANRHQTLMIH